MKLAWIRALTLALTFVSGCASFDGAAPHSTGATFRTFDAPLSRVKPAVISTLAGMGMMISSLEVNGGREVIKARKAGSEVEIEFERVSGISTRVRIAARNGGLFYDSATADRIIVEMNKRLGKA